MKNKRQKKEDGRGILMPRETDKSDGLYLAQAFGGRDHGPIDPDDPRVVVREGRELRRKYER